MKMNHKFTFELRHLASGDYDTVLDKDCIEEHELTSDCGSLAEHLKRNSCPKKQGVIGDCHYELYVQQDVIIKSKSEDKAWKKSTLESELDKYLEKNNVTEFGPEDFEGDLGEFIVQETSDPVGNSKMKIVHEKLYYNNEVDQ